MKFKLLLLLTTLSLVVFGTEGHAQGVMRGDVSTTNSNDLTQASQQQFQLELIVDEIEEAGFELDVEEGFDEEWEEDIWVASDEEDIDALLVDPDDNAFPEDDELSKEEVEDGEWETVYEGGVLAYEDELEEVDMIYSSEGMDYEEEVMIWVDSEEMEIDDLMMEQDWTEEIEEAFDPGWEEVMETWELEEMEFEMEDDLDLLEAIYNAG